MANITLFLLLFLCKILVEAAKSANIEDLVQANQPNCTYRYEPLAITALREGLLADVLVNLSCVEQGSRELNIRTEDASIAEIVGRKSFKTNGLTNFNFTVRGKQFGRTVVHLYSRMPIQRSGNAFFASEKRESNFEYSVAIIRKPNKLLNIVFASVLGVLVVFNNIGFGCKIRPRVIKEILKKPVAPVIGFCCQFLVMAPLSFGVGKFLQMGPLPAIGLLTVGSSPGGGGSNIFAILLDADLELSITMTFFSTLAALGMTPFWLWLLGSMLGVGGGRVSIPVQNVFMSLTIAVVPVVGGVILGHFKEELAARITKYIKPIFFCTGNLFMGLALWMFWYAIIRTTWRTVVACMLVPLLGYMIGGLVAFLFRQDRARIVTIALETGFQNMSLSMFMLRISLPAPEVDIASVVPICYMFLGAVFPGFWFLFREGRRIFRRCKDRKLKAHEAEALRDIQTSEDR